MSTELGLLLAVIPVSALCELVLQFEHSHTVGCVLCSKRRCYFTDKRRQSYSYRRLYNDVCEFCIQAAGLCRPTFCHEMSSYCCFHMSYCFFCKRLMTDHGRATAHGERCPFEMCLECQDRLVLPFHPAATRRAN